MAQWLTHIGLLLVLLFALLGNSQLQKLRLQAFPERAIDVAYDDEMAMFQLPFHITLNGFEAEFYNNGQPKSYKADVVLSGDGSERQAVLEINHPARFMGYDVYLESYDQTNPQNPDFVTFIVVYDVYVWAKYISIIVLLLGLFWGIYKLPYRQNRAVALSVLLFGLGFSLLPFGGYLFGEKHLIPALQSIWFVPHIAVYMLAYGALTIAFLISIYLLLNGKKDVQKPLNFSLKLGVSLMGIGLFFGALWAKTAWGRFWNFDLKETWAAIAWVAFWGVLHFNSFVASTPLSHRSAVVEPFGFAQDKLRRSYQKLLAIFIIIAFLLLQMCWFGINYLPEGWKSLHRY
jgi:hypothetical protein